MKQDSEFLQHEACTSCGSSDALARYSDGHGHCFACQHYAPAEGDAAPTHTRRRTTLTEWIAGEARDLLKRGIRKATAEKYGYHVGVNQSGQTVQVANYRPNGELVAQKIRTADKGFSVIGDGKGHAMGLWGRQLWRDGGRRIVITEGEIDCLSVSQVFRLSWPVVSLPNGASGAVKAIQHDLEWLESYEQVVLMFDMDEPGRKAAAECAALFSPGKCAIASLPLKDANELLVAGRDKDITTAVYEAKTYRPGGIVNGSETWEAMSATAEPGWPYPDCLGGLNKMLLGQHPRRLVTWTSGTGMGKSTAVAEVAYDLAIRQGRTVGYVALEEGLGRSAQRFVGLHLSKPIHLPGVTVPPDVLRTAFDETLGTGRMFFYDHFGSMGKDSLMSKLRYLIKGCKCDVLFLDHLSIIVSGSEDSDERRLIDRTMTALRSLVEETGVLLHLVSHLKRGEGRSHEEGGRVTLAQLRGSHAIAQLSDTVVGLERDTQDEDESDVATIRVLKDRLTGRMGVAGRLRYNAGTGRMEDADVGAAF